MFEQKKWWSHTSMVKKNRLTAEWRKQVAEEEQRGGGQLSPFLLIPNWFLMKSRGNKVTDVCQRMLCNSICVTVNVEGVTVCDTIISMLISEQNKQKHFKEEKQFSLWMSVLPEAIKHPLCLSLCLPVQLFQLEFTKSFPRGLSGNTGKTQNNQ